MRKRHLLHITYFLNFFFALHSFAVLYINSSVLSNAVGEHLVGIVYAIASIAAIIALSIVPRILRNVGDVRFTVFVILAEILVTLALSFVSTPYIIVLLFVVHVICIRIILMDLDVFLESTSANDDTGVVRGTFLTVANTALIISPLLVGLLLGKTEGYARVYFFAAMVLLPIAAVLLFSFKHFKDPVYLSTSLRSAWRRLQERIAVRRIVYIDFMLRFFYAWMVIYLPLYLHNYVGLPWDRIGVIFTIMLIPFALFELPLGTLADKAYGEKELLIIGLSIMAGTTILLSFIHTTSFIVWMLALFATRVGASMVEIMSETYFFKTVGKEDTDLIGLFRSIEPAAYVVGALAATLLLFVIHVQFLFVVLGIIIVTAIPIAVRLVDTR